MRPGNLIRLKDIRCLACYDFGEIIDKLDHSKRRPCDCQREERSPTSDVPITRLWEQIRAMGKNEFYRQYFWKL
jgi:hypothetical protein